MSELKDDGGSEFPRLENQIGFDGMKFLTMAEKGMSLRDWFAGMALRGFCSSGADTQTKGEFYIQCVVPQCFKIADAMIEARKSAQRKEE